MECIVYEQAPLELDSLRHFQPVELVPQSWHDMVEPCVIKDNSRRNVEDRLHSSELLLRYTGEDDVAVIHSGDDD